MRALRIIPLVLISAFLVVASHSNSLADWRNEIGVFRVGIVNQNSASSTRTKLEPFRQAVEDTLEMDVELFVASSAELLIDALSKGRIEYAVLSASGYALTWTLCKCVEPLVIPRASDSTDSYHLLALARSDSGITLSDAANSKVAVLSQQSIVGADLIKYLLTKTNPGIDTTKIQLQSRDSSDQTQSAFELGEFDILFGWSSLTGDPATGYTRGTLRDLVDTSRDEDQGYDIIWQSKQIPHRPHVIRNKIDQEAKSLLAGMLTRLYERDPVAYDIIEPIYGGGFSATRHDRFELLIDYFSTFGKEKADLNDPPNVSE